MTSGPNLNSEKLKAHRERAIFARFAFAAGLDIDSETIESRRPPAPDISCATAFGERVAFELAELCSPDIAKAVGHDLKRGGGATFTWTADPTRTVLLKKLRKIYACDAPVHLLCYADGFLVTTDDAVLDEMREVIGTEGTRSVLLDLVPRRGRRVSRSVIPITEGWVQRSQVRGGAFQIGRATMGPSNRRGMWTNDQEWRDQVIVQLIYLRTAIYFVAFVASLGFAASYAQLIGLPEQSSAVIVVALVVVAVALYWRAHNKTMRIEKRVMSIDYDNYG